MHDKIRRSNGHHDASQFPCGFCGEFIWPGEDHKDGLCMLGRAPATVQLAYDTITQEQQKSLERSILPNRWAPRGEQIMLSEWRNDEPT